MPVTAMLLVKLRETLGEEATNDLVAWIDPATRWEQGLAGVRDEQARMREDQARMREELARFREELARLREEQVRLREELVQGLAALRVDLASQRSDLIKWMFIFWAGTIVPLAGLMVALVRL
jgi:predicted nuclease with TOPRIM domain